MITRDDYDTFTSYVTRYGMDNKMSFEEFCRVGEVVKHIPAMQAVNVAYGINCDMLAGLSFERALAVNTEAFDE